MQVECINTRLLSRGPLRVRVLKVETPTFFWIMLENGLGELTELIEDMSHRINRRAHLLHHRPDHVQPGELVAIREGRRWQRGIIERVSGDTATILLRDWGQIVTRDLFECYTLEDRFREVHWKAIPCGLAYIKPIGSGIYWPDRVNVLTKHLIEGREGTIQIHGSHADEAAAVSFEAVRQSEDEINNLKDLLIRMGCAQPSDAMMLGINNSDDQAEEAA